MRIGRDYYIRLGEEDSTSSDMGVLERMEGLKGSIVLVAVGFCSLYLRKREVKRATKIKGTNMNRPFREQLAGKIKPSTVLAFGTEAAGLTNREYQTVAELPTETQIATFEDSKGNYSRRQSVSVIGNVERVTYSETRQ